ncbi:MAG: serpin family protein [Eubacterium sp.]|nr:serpin family protein [Eubacterium sp.]
MLKKHKGFKRRMAVSLLAGMMLLSACGKTGTKEGNTREVNKITTEADNGNNGKNGNNGSSLNLNTEVTKKDGGISAEKGKTTNLSASLDKGTVTDPTKEQEVAFVRGTASFSFDMMKSLVARDKGQNVMISPDSIITALAMTENGAKDDTLKCMQQVMCKELSLEEYNLALSGFNKKLTGAEKVSFNAANSIWLKNDGQINISQDFLQTNVDYHDAEFYMADFDEKTVEDINGWINDKTKGMIPQMLDKINEDTLMYLINAIAFEGEWREEYTDDQISTDRQFTNAKGETETVTMLHSTEQGYISLKDGLGFVKYYKGNEFAYVAILPPEGMGADEYISSISGEDFIDAYNNRNTYTDAHVTMPEYTSDYNVSLKDTLKNMGMELAFSDVADFSKMTANGESVLKIGDVLHKTHIEVDRKGTKAAAATIVAMDTEAAVAPEESVIITLDRPFVYAIVETDTGLPVFLGTVNSVNGQ